MMFKKTIKKTLAILVVLFFNLSIQAQQKENSKEFNSKFKEAEDYMAVSNYNAALPVFLDLNALDPENANVNFKIGMCYLNSAAEKRKAVQYLEKAVKDMNPKFAENSANERHAPETAEYDLAMAYHHDYNFDKAMEWYEKYKAVLNPVKDAKLIKLITRQIEMCVYAKEMIKTPTNVIITDLGDSINSIYPDFAPVISADESTIIFTSRRDGSTGGLVDTDGQFFEDIYISNKNDGNRWKKARQISGINGEENDAAIGLSADGQELFIYEDEHGEGNIYHSKLKGDAWTTPQKMGSDINTKFWEPSASMTSDGNVLYFVSDRPGGLGGRDIYRCKKLPNGEWSLAQNLGNVINTEYDEDAPFISIDGKTLYFSSKGHKTMGGFDIMFAPHSEEDNSWGAPINIGAPINTPDDDIFYVTTPDEKRAYYSSAKEGGFGEKDIYLITYPEREGKSIAVFQGKIIDNVNKDREIDASNTIVVKNITKDEDPEYYYANTKTGKFIFALEPGNRYQITGQIKGKDFYNETLEVTNTGSFQLIYREMALDTLKWNNEKYLNSEQGKRDVALRAKAEKEALEIHERSVREAKEMSEREAKLPAEKSVKENMTALPGEYAVGFGYNKEDVTTDKMLSDFIDKVEGLVKIGSKVEIVIESSASKVPTSYRGGNAALSKSRAENGKKRIEKLLKEKGVDLKMVTYLAPNCIVSGPEYNNDYIENRLTYEKFQYFKVEVK
jgi:tetratricopeptide (TPR) repeat protein